MDEVTEQEIPNWAMTCVGSTVADSEPAHRSREGSGSGGETTTDSLSRYTPDANYFKSAEWYVESTVHTGTRFISH